MLKEEWDEILEGFPERLWSHLGDEFRERKEKPLRGEWKTEKGFNRASNIICVSYTGTLQRSTSSLETPLLNIIHRQLYMYNKIRFTLSSSCCYCCCGCWCYYNILSITRNRTFAHCYLWNHSCMMQIQDNTKVYSDDSGGLV